MIVYQIDWYLRLSIIQVHGDVVNDFLAADESGQLRLQVTF